MGTFSFADGRTFQGEWIDGMIVSGKMQYVNGDLFDGHWKNGVKDNRGVYRLTNGETYDGYWLNNEKHGVGVTKIPGEISKGWECWAHDRIIEVKDKDWYAGDVQNSLTRAPHGKGTTLHQNGEVYSGEYQNGERNGYGTLFHPVNAKGEVEIAYAGHWNNDLKHGEGLMREYQPAKCESPEPTNSTPSIISEYKGYFVNGVKEGLGVEVDLRSGRWREGEWKGNEMCGHGKFFYPAQTVNDSTGVRYEGNWENGLFHGLGVLWDEDGSVYRGGFKYGERHGSQCDELYVDGSHYCGNFARNGREGQGKMIFKANVDGDMTNSYVGSWRGGRFHGHGVRLFPDGTRYEGEYADGKPHGIGRMVYAKSKHVIQFDGRWEAGQCRDGTESYSDGTEYSGEMLDGLRDGRGQMVWGSGDIYEGDWRRGFMHGQGKYTYMTTEDRSTAKSEEETKNTSPKAKNDVYIGDWFEGKRHGKGSLAYRNGDVYDGSWLHDERTGEGEMLHADGRVYVGSFIKGKKDGRGMQTWAEGSRYKGEWHGDVMEGEGVYRYADGRRVEGQFSKGRPHGEDTVGITSDDRVYHRGNWDRGEPVKINSKGKKERSVYRTLTLKAPLQANDTDMA